MVLLGSLLNFFSVLLATLIGVYSAFLLDRWQQERQSRQNTVDHLRSIQQEIELNSKRANANNRLIDHLQRRDMEGDHYVLEPFETDAWLAALEEPILGTISPDVYRKIQDTYSQVKSTNSLIERQMSEMHHRSLGQETELEGWDYENWTINVNYYVREEEEVEYLGLAPLIKRRSRSIERTSDLSDELDEEIERLNDYPLKQHADEIFFD